MSSSVGAGSGQKPPMSPRQKRNSRAEVSSMNAAVAAKLLYGPPASATVVQVSGRVSSSVRIGTCSSTDVGKKCGRITQAEPRADQDCQHVSESFPDAHADEFARVGRHGGLR